MPKVVLENQVNDSEINAQDATDFIDKNTGTYKSKERNAAGAIVVRSVVGVMKPMVEGEITLVDGKLTVGIQIPQNGSPIFKIFLEHVFPLSGNSGQKSVEVTIPGGPGLPGEFVVHSADALDTDTLNYVVYQSQL